MTDRNGSPAPEAGDASEESALFDQMLDYIESGENGPMPEETAPPAGDAGEDQAGADAADAPSGEGETPRAKDRQGEGGDDDIWANAPEKLREQYDALQRDLAKARQSDSSQRGRVAAMQREIDEFRKRYEQDQASDDGEQADPFEALNAIEEDYPDLARPFKDAILRQQEQMEALRKAHQAQVEAGYRANAERVAQEHPDYARLIADNQAEFSNWLYNQPLWVYQAFERNQKTIVDPAEASEVVARFKQHLGMQRSSPTETPLSERRRMQKEAASPPRRTAQPRATGGPPSSDPEAMFNYFAKQIAKEQGL